MPTARAQSSVSSSSHATWFSTLGIHGRNENRREENAYAQNDNGQPDAGQSYNITCKWEPFKEQIMLQWNRLTSHDLDRIGPNRGKLAVLIEKRYGIAAHLVENYLRNFERTLPLI